MATTQALTLRDEQAVATRGNQITDVQRLGGLLAASGYFADAREMAQAAVKVLAGEELGIPPVAAMMGINIIKGKIALGGNLIASRIRAHGFDFIHKRFDNEACVLVFLGRKGDPDIGKGTIGPRPIIGESSFTMEDAKTAQVTGNEHYKKNPRNMLFNRAISNGAKWYTPEVFAGAPVYVPEELGAQVDEQGDYVAEALPAPKPDPRAAARAVAEHKIAEMKAGKSYQEISTPDPRNNIEDAEPETLPPYEVPSSSLPTVKAFHISGKFDRLKMFGQMKAAIGDQPYYRILGSHGVEHGNEFTKLATAEAALAEMLAEYADQTRSRAI